MFLKVPTTSQLSSLFVAKLSLLLCLIANAPHAAAAPIDFTGDGQSNPATVLDSSPLSWRAATPQGMMSVVDGFGELGVHLAPGRYSSTPITQPAFITNQGLWYIWQGNRIVSFHHGEEKATYLAGADVDGDGVTDAIYHNRRCMRRRVQVFTRTNPLSDQPGSYQLLGGRGIFFTTYGDANGNGRDDFCSVEALPRNRRHRYRRRFTVDCKDVLTGRRVANFRAGLVFDRPLPVTAGPGQPVYFAFPRRLNNAVRVVVRNVRGQVVRRMTFPTTGTLVIGNYLNQSPGPEQIALAVNNTLQVYDIATDSITEVTQPRGIPFDEININHFDESLNNCICTTDRINRQGRCTRGGGGGSGGCEVNRPISDGPGGWLHKPVSDSTGSIVNLFNRSDNPTNCRYDDSSGKLFREGYFSGYANGNRPHWRPSGGGSCASFPKNMIVSCEIGGRRHCWKIPDPCGRYD